MSKEDNKEEVIVPEKPKVKLPIRESHLKTPPGYCPKCGAYVGAFYSCSECGAKMPHGTKLRILQFLTVAFLILGLIGLGIYSGINPAPKVNIGDISETWSNGIVTIEGNVTNIDYREASDGTWKTLIFTVEDQTGKIDVKAYTETVNEMIDELNTPAIGDVCTVRGSIYIRGDELYLLIDSSTYFTPIREVDLYYNSTNLYDLFVANPTSVEGKRVEVNGTISYIDSEMTFFELDEVVRIYYPEYVRLFSPDQTVTIVEGSVVNVTGIIEDYYGTLEVLPASTADIEVIEYGGEI
ncbi:MAG: hypothetical protein GF364_07380 [Candidatus Lokiarchaeota archaeon]|nr:hypothetical protein [Candidatus Lokiarchaeota archaeon]